MCDKKQCPHSRKEMCSCIPVKSKDAEDLIKSICHLTEYLIDPVWEFEHTTLDKPEERRLCIIGRCAICGKQLCTGLHVDASLFGDDLLAALYRHLYQFHSGRGCSLRCEVFREKFLLMFPEEEQRRIHDWLNKPENTSVWRMWRRRAEPVEEKKPLIYTIIHTSVDADRGSFPSPSAEGSYCTKEAADEAMWKLVAEEKENRDFHCDVESYAEEHGEDYWECYEKGYAAANFSRFDIVTSVLHHSHSEDSEGGADE